MGLCILSNDKVQGINFLSYLDKRSVSSKSQTNSSFNEPVQSFQPIKKELWSSFLFSPKVKILQDKHRAKETKCTLSRLYKIEWWIPYSLQVTGNCIFPFLNLVPIHLLRCCQRKEQPHDLTSKGSYTSILVEKLNCRHRVQQCSH